MNRDNHNISRAYLKSRLLKEGMENTYPSSWNKAFQHPIEIAGGGTEEPFLKNGKWHIRVYDKEKKKHFIYSYADDVFYPENHGTSDHLEGDYEDRTHAEENNEQIINKKEWKLNMARQGLQKIKDMIMGARMGRLQKDWVEQHMQDSILNEIDYAMENSRPSSEDAEENNEEDLHRGSTNMPHGYGYPNKEETEDWQEVSRLHRLIDDDDYDSPNHVNYPAFVTAYDEIRAYGGPEEGGWYYDAYKGLGSIQVNSLDEAENAAQKLYNKYNERTDGQLKIFIEKDKNSQENKPAPRYE